MIILGLDGWGAGMVRDKTRVELRGPVRLELVRDERGFSSNSDGGMWVDLRWR